MISEREAAEMQLWRQRRGHVQTTFYAAMFVGFCGLIMIISGIVIAVRLNLAAGLGTLGSAPIFGVVATFFYRMYKEANRRLDSLARDLRARS